MHNKYTVTIWFFDGFSSTRDLKDHLELVNYIQGGVAMEMIRSIQIIHHPHAES